MESLRLIKAKEVPPEEVMRFRAEFLSAGERSINGSRGLHNYSSYADWCELVEQCEKPDNKLLGVQATTYFAKRLHDGMIVGCIELRHTLNEALSVIGGHVGYSVVPSERCKGYAARMLRMVIEEARRLGIGRLLLTCDADNLASIKTITRCGGVQDRKEPYIYEGEKYYKFYINTEEDHD